MKPHGVVAELAKLQWQEVQEERALGLGVHRYQLAPGIRPRLSVDGFEVGGLAPEPDAVVDDLEGDFALRVMNQRHSSELPGSGETVKKPAKRVPPSAGVLSNRGVAFPALYGGPGGGVLGRG